MTPTYSLENEFQQWLKTRPKVVQEFAAKHPFRPGDHLCFADIPKELCEPFIDTDKMYYFVGYWQDAQDDSRVGIMLSDIDPSRDYEAATSQKLYIGAEHFDGTDAVQLVPEYRAAH